MIEFGASATLVPPLRVRRYLVPPFDRVASWRRHLSATPSEDAISLALLSSDATSPTLPTGDV